MRRQFPCSKCGLACSSAWKNEHPSKLIICNACKSREKKAAEDQLQHHGQTRSIQSAQIIHSVSMQQSVLPYETTTPVACQQERKQTPKVVASDRQSSIVLRDQSCHGPGLELSLSLSQSKRPIKPEINCENENANKEKSSVWNLNNIQKKRRSKLPQYTLSPIERFVNQLHQASICQKLKGISASHEGHLSLRKKPKYDDFFIYEKCKLISNNEIGVGAVLLSEPIPLIKCSKPAEFVQVKTEPYTDGDYASCLFDVPIRGLSE